MPTHFGKTVVSLSLLALLHSGQCMAQASVDAAASENTPINSPEPSVVDPSEVKAGAVTQDLDKRYSAHAYLDQRRYKEVAVFAVGEGTQRAYVFTPHQPTAKALPLVFFHHGWLGMSPKNFGSLIDLLVRRGAVVIYPVYQDGDHTSPQDVTRLAGEADQAALQALRQRYPGLADEAKTFYFGYSMGAAISTNLALAPDLYGLPAPRALMLVAPGNAHHVVKGVESKSIYGSVESLPAKLPTVVVTGAADSSIGVPTGRSLMARLCHLEHKSLLLLPSDNDGASRVLAGHGSPGAPDSRYDFADARGAYPATIPPRDGFEPSVSLNQLDYYGYWRLATRLMDYVAGGALPTELFRDSPENRYLGRWPSGKTYAPAVVENPCHP